MAWRRFDAVTILNHELCASFDRIAPTGGAVFPAGSPSRAWLETVRAGKSRELAAYKAKGLMVISKLDMVVLPAALVAAFKAEVTDPITHKLSFAMPKTKVSPARGTVTLRSTPQRARAAVKCCHAFHACVRGVCGTVENTSSTRVAGAACPHSSRDTAGGAASGGGACSCVGECVDAAW